MKTFSRRPINQKTVFVFFIMLWLPRLLSAQINVTITPTNITCFGAANGQAKATPTDGWFPYTYAWSNSATTQTIQNLTPGTYTVTVSDIDQNTKIASVSITQPTQLGVTVFTSSAICDIAPDGIANCVPFGGTAPYTYIWNNGSTASQINNLPEGTYTVTVTDAQNCMASDSDVVNAWHEGLWTMISHTPAVCQNADGTAHVSIMSGTPPYQYQWSTGSTTADIEDLSAGAYTVSVSDVNGCSTSGTVLVTEEGILLLPLITNTDCGYNNGSAQVYPLSGLPPYQYLWSNGETSQAIDSLGSGTYLVTVTDAQSCSNTEEITVLSNNTLLSIFTQLPTPFCLNANASFQEKPAPPNYPQRLWTLSDTLDQIISGQGTDTIQVHWSSTGPKTVKYQFGANGVFCGSITYGLQVAVCADTQEPDLARVKIGPNPFSASIQLEFLEGLPLNAEATLTDLSGKPVFSQSLLERKSFLQTAQIPAGLYFLKIGSDTAEKTWKLIKI